MEDKWFIVVKEKHLGQRFTEYLLANSHDSEYTTYFLESGKRINVQTIPDQKTVQWIQSNKDMQLAGIYYCMKKNEDFLRPVSLNDAFQLASGKVVSDPKISGLYDKQAKKSYAWRMLQKAQSLVEQAKSAGNKKVRIMMLNESYTGSSVKLSDLKGRDLQIKEKLRDYFSDVTVEKLRKNYYFYINL